MFIHKTHSKNELVKINNIFKLGISNPKKYRKIELSALLSTKLNLSSKETFDENEYFIYNIIDLKSYLYNCNPKKRLSINEKNNVILICKQIKHYSRNYYNINISEFKDEDDMRRNAIYISQYGDIPSVRKALKELNMKCPDIKPYISPMVQKQLDMKHKLKQKNKGVFQHRTGKFLLEFK